MSRTTIYVAGDDGVMHAGRAFQNSWGGAWFIWDTLWRTYIDAVGYAVGLLTLEAQQTLWALDRDSRLTVDERIALVTTFDRCLIRREDAPVVADAFDQFVARHERRRGDRACHLPLQALYLRELANAAIREIGWQQTSAAVDLWAVYLDDQDEGRPYNVATDTGHFFLFDDYPELRVPCPV